MKDTIFVHESATVDEGAKIGYYTSIWHYSHVESEGVIGENCNLGQNCYVGKNGIIGNACRIGNSVSVFNNVELGDFVFCAPFMVFTHISFPRAAVSQRKIFEKTIVGNGATLGANCTVTPGVVIGEGSFIAGGAVITKNCKDWSLMVGAPARHVGWVSAFGEKMDLPLSGFAEWRCTHTGDIYRLDQNVVHRDVFDEDVLRYIPGKRYVRKEL